MRLQPKPGTPTEKGKNSSSLQSRTFQATLNQRNQRSIKYRERVSLPRLVKAMSSIFEDSMVVEWRVSTDYKPNDPLKKYLSTLRPQLSNTNGIIMVIFGKSANIIKSALLFLGLNNLQVSQSSRFYHERAKDFYFLTENWIFYVFKQDLSNLGSKASSKLAN